MSVLNDQEVFQKDKKPKREIISSIRLLPHALSFSSNWNLHRTWKDPVVRLHTYAFMFSNLYIDTTTGSAHPNTHNHKGWGRGVSVCQRKWWMKVCLGEGRPNRDGVLNERRPTDKTHRTTEKCCLIGWYEAKETQLRTWGQEPQVSDRLSMSIIGLQCPGSIEDIYHPLVVCVYTSWMLFAV